ncbi:M20/M25/M40 family metallo-hydrolase [Proteiniclasticum sp. SCR006]|uniref:M20/M25/M40 family metallo-hydrolase n=1 Tax=Proteiniclasticum aestuarii TaxID=2817862 RepID=A0A939HB99_9CLOT|nr:M20/M25/M40 family metallo-hydrolase [Proteiniclasticum aestuarii]MBO1265278.1 M20/M25/M40 family metallo-hydrolase [Proteiniclasticum aestuarii]
MTAADRSRAAAHLSKALTYRTISFSEEDLADDSAFEAFLSFLERTYPTVYERMNVTLINKYSPVYHLKGRQKGKLPVLLLGHYDVVPVEENTMTDWKRDPFGGEVHESHIYGRGAMDDKNQVISIMESLETLLHEGYEPDRDIFVAFGFDEEVGGEQGAKAIAKYFEEKGLRFHLVLDEGGAVVLDTVEGVKTPLGLIGVAEKGSSMIRITAYGDGGHSSMPKKGSSVEVLSQAVLNLMRNPMKPRLTPPVRELFHGMAPFLGAKGILLRHVDWTFPVLARILSSSSVMNSMVRTTMAMTMAKAGSAMNVMPQEASVYVNVRILPGDTFEDVLLHMKTVNKDLDLSYEVLVREEASLISPHESEAFKAVERNALKVHPDAKVLPYLMAGGSDARKYEKLSDHILRFSCVRMTSADLDSIHATNERIHVDQLFGMIRFYVELLRDYETSE